ncbi:Uncharacterized protein OBRU01_06327 [Operophtera brumata]|uniref:C2H2-type domain-containing protein n=1 Tax=Operophtera brumata TaxID=104452 RepID=A0A0L7LKK6_OPEBR|nr:Uncharacterized protein OBRU01_06327 [Operophtera brumata]
MNFAAFSAVGGAGTHFVTTGGQMPVAKMQQNMGNNSLSQWNMTRFTGDPQPMVQIQVLNPNLLQSQPQKYQMQIPIQGYQGGDNKTLNNNTTTNNNNEACNTIVIKEECDDGTIDDESSQGTEGSEGSPWAMSSSQQDLVKYLNSLPPQPARPKPGQVVIATAADGTPIFCCPECQMAYPEKEQLEMHLGVHKIEHLERHKLGHNPERPYVCGICRKGFKRREHLNLHAVIHSGIKTEMCTECGKGTYTVSLTYKRKEHLERHKLGHNPERPYVCGICRKGFKRREHLNLHAVIHSGIKTEMCTECGKGTYTVSLTYKRKEHLERHKLGHNPERPYVCGVCRKGFKRREHLILHAVIHSGVKTEIKRARDESQANTNTQIFKVENPPAINAGTILPEITIHVPTSSNVSVPVQINIPQHVVSTLEAAQTQQQQSDTQAQLEALLAQHS